MLTHPLAIVMYHAIAPQPAPITIAPDLFRKQIEALARAGLVGRSLGEALARHDGRSVAITFDDGFRDFAEVAWPILHEYGFGATLFLVAGRLGLDNNWPGQAAWAPRLPLLDREQVRRLANDGVEFGAHSVTHRRPASLPPPIAALEVTASRLIVERITGRSCRFYAYPYGAVTPATARAARSFEAAVTTDLRIAGPDNRDHLLPRIDAIYLRPASVAGRVYHPAGAALLATRRLGRQLRQLVER